MTQTMHGFALATLIGAIAIASIAMSGRAAGKGSFFDGREPDGRAPGLWTLVLSQVTTWIFARSLLNVAILGFYYGAPGALAYTVYYASFLTGWMVVDGIRFRAGAASMQAYLRDQFGRAGAACYNLVIALRLLSEVFANLLVVAIIFDGLFPDSRAGACSIVVLALVGLGYSMMGGLRASLRTDVMQMLAFLVVFAITFLAMLTHDTFSLVATLSAQGTAGPAPGWVLVAVAVLQIWSYPTHDPVMTDRGFLADRETTRRSFLHAFWISTLCIFGFGLLGVHAGLVAGPGETMQAAWARLYDPAIMLCLNAAMIISAMSTLDSTLCSAARLAVRDMRIGAETIANGRIAMAVFMLGGVAMMLADLNNLYAAVAVSGTASMFLAPVLFFNILGGARAVPVWSYVAGFLAAMGGAMLYFFVESKAGWALELTGGVHKYTALLWICISVLVIGNAAFGIGLAMRRRTAVV